MQLIIVLHDHKGTVHAQTTCSIGEKATIDELKKEIQSVLAMGIEPKYQELTFNGVLLRVGTLAEAGLKDRSTVIVKHALLPTWEACLEASDNLSKTNADRLRDAFANKGFQLLQKLEKSDFFMVYVRFAMDSVRKMEQFDPYLIGTEELIKIAVRSYFKLHFKDEGLSVKFKTKPNTGAQGGFICHVRGEDYFVKNHTFMSRGADHSRVDLRELFVYRLLQFIGVGPEAHFIPSAYSNRYISNLALHIATKEAARVCFPDAVISCCLFHPGQSIYRRIQSSEILNRQYATDNQLRRTMKSLQALAFVPISHVYEYLCCLVESINPNVNPELLNLFKYFFKNYVGREFAINNPIHPPLTDDQEGYIGERWIRTNFIDGVCQNSRARFPPPLWNMVDRLESDLSRTNNSLEAWHAVWNSILHPRPRVSVVFHKIKEEEELQQGVIEDYENSPADGIRANPRKQKDLRKDTNLLALYEMINQKTPVDYLGKIQAFLRIAKV